MKKHTKIYLDYFGYGIEDYVPCEICGNKAVDIHHIDCRGMGGSSKKDKIENLMALCRECHITYGDKKQHTERLQERHDLRLKNK
jgi:5-methylcytosine-specific restriction endonuclease McrA